MFEKTTRSVLPDFKGCIEVSENVIRTTENHFRDYSEKQHEAYVWWAGRFIDSKLAIVNKVLAFNENDSIYGTVSLQSGALLKMQEILRREQLVLIAELHTHPPGANGQSYLDSRNPATTYPGFISVIVPDFCEKDLGDLTHCFVYRYIKNFEWSEMSPAEISELLKIQ